MRVRHPKIVRSELPGQQNVVRFDYGSMYAKVVLDSVGEHGWRITSIEARYPRYIHSENMTHRAKATNSASSRAIPFAKLAAITEADPWFPEEWPAEQKGMQGGASLPSLNSWLLDREWAHLQKQTLASCRRMVKYGLHKSLANRPLEWFGYITVLMTATRWQNYLRLRDHEKAEPRFQTLARMVRMALDTSVPRRIKAGGWHLPYVSIEEQKQFGDIEVLKKISTARCARLSFLTQDGVRDTLKDIELYQRLLDGAGDGQPHATPFEHPSESQAVPAWSGPFFGWKQYRKEIPDEVAPEVPYAGPVLEDDLCTS